jgi:hypothetical protein
MTHQIFAESPFNLNQDELWVVQRRVYRRGNKSTWKTITKAIPYREAFEELHDYPSETTRLMSGIQEYCHTGAMQREI